jgi:hypothetical protein
MLHPRQPLVQALVEEAEPFVIEAHQVQDRRVKKRRQDPIGECNVPESRSRKIGEVDQQRKRRPQLPHELIVRSHHSHPLSSTKSSLHRLRK